MAASVRISPRRYRIFTHATIDQVAQVERLSPEDRLAMNAVSAVLPFRVESYVLDELIDRDDIPGDPMFQLILALAAALGALLARLLCARARR
jgi:L-lysine 2,3-aminomutase